MQPVARLIDVSQGFGQRLVLSGASLDVETGVQGLLGPNGAGKTTLLRTLATVVPPRSGRVQIQGRFIEGQREVGRVRSSIGYLPQYFGYFPGFSVRDFVLYCAWLRGVPSKEARTAADESIDRVKLMDHANSKLRTLSGGMLRRVGIAQAIVSRPRLLLLDEPTVGLDPEQRFEFRQAVASIASESPDMAVVLSTHLVEDIAAICSRVIVLAAGAFIFEGTPDELEEVGRHGARGDSSIERGYLAVLDRSGQR